MGRVLYGGDPIAAWLLGDPVDGACTLVGRGSGWDARSIPSSPIALHQWWFTTGGPTSEAHQVDVVSNTQ